MTNQRNVLSPVRCPDALCYLSIYLCLRAGGQLRCRRYDDGGGPIRQRVNGWGAPHVRPSALAAALEPRQSHHFPPGPFPRTVLYATTSPVAVSRQPPAFSSPSALSSRQTAGISLQSLRPQQSAPESGLTSPLTQLL